MKKQPKKVSKKTRVPTLYLYVSASARKHAITVGREKFGTASKYVNHLIARDRGVRAPKAKTA